MLILVHSTVPYDCVQQVTLEIHEYPTAQNKLFINK